jgi:hypothetical protein
MNNNKRLGIFIIAVAGVLLVAMGIYTYIFNQNQKKANQQISTTPAPNPNALLEQAKINQPPPVYTFDSTAEANRALNAEDIKKIAMPFAERFGSFSNQSNYDNFTDLKIFMTDKMSAWADNYVAQLKKGDQDNTVYYGLTTTAISGEVRKFDAAAGQAEVLIATQRREVKNGQTTNFNQDILLNLMRVKNEWKFDAAFWQK